MIFIFYGSSRHAQFSQFDTVSSECKRGITAAPEGSSETSHVTTSWQSKQCNVTKVKHDLLIALTKMIEMRG